MKIKQFFSIAFCMVLITTVLAGCGANSAGEEQINSNTEAGMEKGDDPQGSQEPSGSPSPSLEPTTVEDENSQEDSEAETAKPDKEKEASPTPSPENKAGDTTPTPAANKESEKASGNQTGAATPKPKEEEEKEPAVIEEPARGYYYVYGGKPISMNEDLLSVFSKLGDPDDVFESPSCAFEGIDKIIYYDGFIINSYPAGKKDYVLSLNLTSESAKTPEGLSLGMTYADMVEKYGEGYTNTLDLYTYTKDSTELSILIEEDKIVDILYYYPGKKHK